MHMQRWLWRLSDCVNCLIVALTHCHLHTGPLQGECECTRGVLGEPRCVCNEGFTGANCNCSLSTTNCTDNQVSMWIHKILSLSHHCREQSALKMATVCVACVSVLATVVALCVNDAQTR